MADPTVFYENGTLRIVADTDTKRVFLQRPGSNGLKETFWTDESVVQVADLPEEQDVAGQPQPAHDINAKAAAAIWTVAYELARAIHESAKGG